MVNWFGLAAYNCHKIPVFQIPSQVFKNGERNSVSLDYAHDLHIHYMIILVNTYIDRLHAQSPSGCRTKLRHWRTRLKLPVIIGGLEPKTSCTAQEISRYYLDLLACLIWNTSQRTTRMGMPEHLMTLDRLTAITYTAANGSSEPVTMARSANK